MIKILTRTIFFAAHTNKQIEREQWVEFHTLVNVSNGGPMAYTISGNGEEYLDLSQTQLYIIAKILNNNGTVLKDNS